MSSISYFRLPPSISMFFFYIYLQFLVFSQMGTCTSTRLLIIPINKIPRTWKYQIYIIYVHNILYSVYTLPSNLIDTQPPQSELIMNFIIIYATYGILITLPPGQIWVPIRDAGSALENFHYSEKRSDIGRRQLS